MDRHVQGQPACGHFRGQGSGWSGTGTDPAPHLGWIQRPPVRPAAMVTRPGGSEVMLLPSSPLTFLPVWPAAPFFLQSLLGLVSPALVSPPLS